MGTKKKKCKNCGRLFDSEEESEQFCSALCRTTALFVGGGGDQRKPYAESTPKKVIEAAKAAANKAPKTSKRGNDVKFPRVKELFSIPHEKRWELARTFSPDEMAYARRIASRILNEDRMLDEFSSWERQEEGEGEFEAGMLGESDDGSV